MNLVSENMEAQTFLDSWGVSWRSSNTHVLKACPRPASLGMVLGTERREKAVSLLPWSWGLALGASSLQHLLLCRSPAVPCLHQELFPCKEQRPTQSSASLK